MDYYYPKKERQIERDLRWSKITRIIMDGIEELSHDNACPCKFRFLI